MKPPPTQSRYPSRRFCGIVTFIFVVTMLYLIFAPTPQPASFGEHGYGQSLDDEGKKEAAKVEQTSDEELPEFEPTEEWQEVKPGQAIPPGLEIKMPMGGQGPTMARYKPGSEHPDIEHHDLIAHPGNPGITENEKLSSGTSVGGDHEFQRDMQDLSSLIETLEKDERNAGPVKEDRSKIVEALHSLRELVGDIKIGEEFAKNTKALKNVFRMVKGHIGTLRDAAAEVIQASMQNDFLATNTALKGLGEKKIHELTDLTWTNPAATTALSSSIVGNCRGVGWFWNHTWLDPKGQKVSENATDPKNERWIKLVASTINNLKTMVDSLDEPRTKKQESAKDSVKWRLDLTPKHVSARLKYICDDFNKVTLDIIAEHSGAGPVPYYHVPDRFISAANVINDMIDPKACWDIVCGDDGAFIGASSVTKCQEIPKSDQTEAKCKPSADMKKFIKEMNVDFEDMSKHEIENWKKPFLEFLKQGDEI